LKSFIKSFFSILTISILEFEAGIWNKKLIRKENLRKYNYKNRMKKLERITK